MPAMSPRGVPTPRASDNQDPPGAARACGYSSPVVLLIILDQEFLSLEIAFQIFRLHHLTLPPFHLFTEIDGFNDEVGLIGCVLAAGSRTDASFVCLQLVAKDQRCAIQAELAAELVLEESLVAEVHELCVV